MALARDDQGVEDGRALTGVRMADEEPVFLADARRADGIFYAEIAIMPSSSGRAGGVAGSDGQNRHPYLGIITLLRGRPGDGKTLGARDRTDVLVRIDAASSRL
jgi:hypothetical protein